MVEAEQTLAVFELTLIVGGVLTVTVKGTVVELQVVEVLLTVM